MEALILVLFYVFFPAIIIFLSEKFSIIDKIGTIVIAYICGLILGNSGILNEDGRQIQEMVANVSILLAMPLLLFSTDIRGWFKLAGKTILATVLSIMGLLIILIIGNLIFENKIPEVYKISGMLAGVYTGGTPNLASIKTALNVNHDTYILVHTYDTIISAIFILFLITIGQRVFLLFLKPFDDRINLDPSNNQSPGEEFESFSAIFKKSKVLPLLIAFCISIIIMASGGGLSMLVSANSSTAIAILTITSLGIAFSLIPAVNKIEASFHLGMYLILIFSLDVASMANLSAISEESLYLLYYVVLAIFGTVFLQVILSKIFKIDADTTIIILTTLICSPPFVPMVAGALKNKKIIISGLTIGVFGYAIGNYLGIFLAWFLNNS